MSTWGLWARTPRSVVGWSETRLPFDPRGELADYRVALRSALRQMQGSPIDGLSVAYLAPDDGVCDVENVSLYNLGVASYSHLTDAGVACRREQSTDGRHWLRYEVGSLPVPRFEGSESVAALATNILTLHRTTDEWFSALASSVIRRDAVAPESFTVDVTISGPWAGRTVAGITKPLLDGVVRALLGADASAAREELALSSAGPGRRGVQGEPRRLVRFDRGGVAWNPAGDRCRAFRVRVRRASTASITAELCS